MTSLELWPAVDRLMDRLLEKDALGDERVAELRDHRVHLLAAARVRARGETPPLSLRRDEGMAAMLALAMPVVLARVREVCDGPLLLMKGPEVAAHYPDPVRRPFVDVDLLTPDPAGAQRALVAAGFKLADPAWEWLEGPDHQLPPLHWPGLPLSVEVHNHPHWVDGLRPPSCAELLDAAGPSRVGVDGLLAPAPEHHALLLAAHAWAHRPLGRLGQLIDVEAMSRVADAQALERTARAWGCARLLRTTRKAAAAALDGRRTGSMRIWARHLREGRERTVVGTHLQRWLAPTCGFPWTQVPRAFTGAVWDDLRPGRGEGWPTQVQRMLAALTHARSAESEHLASAPPGADHIIAQSKGGTC
jgi:hypothetical protein